jgi:uncharacterized protein (TIGR02246 family)
MRTLRHIEQSLRGIVNPKLITMLTLCSALATATSYAAGTDPDADAIRAVVEQRRIAGNAEDTDSYARLLTPDADIVSATGRSAYGREGIIQLYVEQRSGAYLGAIITSTVVTRIKFVRPDVAVVDADFELTGVRGRDGNPMAPISGLNTFILTKENGQWLISSIRGIPRTPIQGPRQ